MGHFSGSRVFPFTGAAGQCPFPAHGRTHGSKRGHAHQGCRAYSCACVTYHPSLPGPAYLLLPVFHDDCGGSSGTGVLLLWPPGRLVHGYIFGSVHHSSCDRRIFSVTSARWQTPEASYAAKELKCLGPASF